MKGWSWLVQKTLFGLDSKVDYTSRRSDLIRHCSVMRYQLRARISYVAWENRNDRHWYKRSNQETETRWFKLKTKFMNERFINELDKIGLQPIDNRGTFIGRLLVLLEAKIWIQSHLKRLHSSIFSDLIITNNKFMPCTLYGLHSLHFL